MHTKIEHFTSLEAAVSALFGENVRIEGMNRIAGGDINEAFGLSLSDGETVFMKMNRKENLDFFLREVTGLQAIRSTKAIGSPEVLCTGTDEKRRASFLLLEYVRGKGRISGSSEIFAHELAAMHRADTGAFLSGGKYGFSEDNYIGAGEQENTPEKSWVTFFRDRRLLPQIKRASHYMGTGDRRKIEHLLSHLEDYLPEPEQPSLLHGDMWSGNIMTGNDGKVWLIDPAAYVGHAEADIAMTELFGRLPAAFYKAYEEEGLMQPGYEERRDLYNLYHMFNHLNLFGNSYLHSVRRIVERYS